MVTIKNIGNKYRITNKGKVESSDPTSATNNPILGNVHRLCKRCINIITKSLHHVYLFLLIFSDFLAIFASITILGNAHRPCKQYINIVDSSLCHATSFFSDLFLVFWAYLH